MKRHPLRLLAVPLLVTAAIGAGSSCSTPTTGPASSRPSAVQEPATAAPAAAGLSIAQQDHGREARFATCTQPACPVVTPKTLAIDLPDAAATAPRAIPITAPVSAAARSPGPRETLLVPAVRAPAAPAREPGLKVERLAAPQVTEVIVTFPFGSAVLSASARASIDAAAMGDGIGRIDIRGRTDNVGPAAANDLLARQRASAVAQYLRARHPHLADAEVHIDGRGACCYATGNDTPEGRARNRRVEIAFQRAPTDP